MEYFAPDPFIASSVHKRMGRMYRGLKYLIFEADAIPPEKAIKMIEMFGSDPANVGHMFNDMEDIICKVSKTDNDLYVFKYTGEVVKRTKKDICEIQVSVKDGALSLVTDSDMESYTLAELKRIKLDADKKYKKTEDASSKRLNFDDDD